MDEDIVQRWLRYSELDMASAETLQGVGHHLNAVFHVQQAVEKALKGFLLNRTGAEPPRIHALRKLADRCGLTLTSDQALLLEKLSTYYVESRYPGEWQEASSGAIREEVERLIPAAKEFIRWLRSQI